MTDTDRLAALRYETTLAALRAAEKRLRDCGEVFMHDGCIEAADAAAAALAAGVRAAQAVEEALARLLRAKEEVAP